MGAGYLNQANHESIAVAWVTAQASALKIFPNLGLLQELPISMPPISWRRTTIPACGMRPVVSSSAVRSKQMSTTLVVILVDRWQTRGAQKAFLAPPNFAHLNSCEQWS
jgi:hypothetical protein